MADGNDAGLPRLWLATPLQMDDVCQQGELSFLCLLSMPFSVFLSMPFSVFLVLQGCSTGALESTLLGAGFPYYTRPTHSPTLLACPQLIRAQKPLWPDVAFPTTSRLQLALELNCPVFCSIRRPYITFKLLRGDMDTPPHLCNLFRYLAIGMCHFRYLWNGLCDRHRAEITVMQFRGHSLPVRQFMRV